MSYLAPRPPPDIEGWLSHVRDHVLRLAPDIVALLDPYIAEARFGRSYIRQDLAHVTAGACVLEVGAGSMLLSCQLAREGFRVMALEPVGRGFSHFDQLRHLVLECAREVGHAPLLIDKPAEQLGLVASVDYAFSINVMEHVDDVPRVIAQIAQSLKVGAKYRFTCPNYLFPYEPHFNIFTFFSKRLTERLRSGRIFGREDINNPTDVWRSLNWISVPSVARIVRTIPGLRAEFNPKLLVSTVERMSTDSQFSSRHGGVLRIFLLGLLHLRLHRLFAIVPASLQPVMDCVMTRTEIPEAA